MTNDEITTKVSEYFEESRSRCYCNQYRDNSNHLCGYHEGMQDGMDLVQDLLTGNYGTAPVSKFPRLYRVLELLSHGGASILVKKL